MPVYQKRFLSIFLLIFFGGILPLNSLVLAADEVTIEISVDSSASAIGPNVQAGSSSSDFNIIKIENASALPIVVNTIKISRSGGSDADFNSVSLYSVSPAGARSQIGSTQYTTSSGVVYFDIYSSIAANSSILIAVCASVASTAQAGDVVSWSLASAEDINVTVVGSSVQPTITGSAVGVSRTILGTGPDVTPPATPGNIIVEPVGLSPTLKISWADPADTDLDKIKIYRSTILGQAGTLIHTSNRGFGIIPVTTYSDTSVAAGTTYYYTVKSSDFVGNESTDTTQYSGMVYARGLNIFLDSSSPSAGNVNASSTDVILAVFKFYASNVDAEVTNLNISGAADAAGNNNLDQISFLSLFVDDTFVASTTGAVFTFYTNYSKLTIPANSSKILSFKADIPLGSRNGAEIVLKVDSLRAQEPSWYPVTVHGLGAFANEMIITGGTVIPLPSPASPSVSTDDIPEGALIRSNGDIDVYIVKYVGVKKFKRLILSPSVFNNYGHLKWEDIRDVNQSIVDAFVTSELVRAVGDEKVYKLYPAGDTGQKRWIKTADVFSGMGFDSDAIYEINSFDRDSYLTGEDLE